MSLGTVKLGRIELPIVDCRSWYVAGKSAHCRLDLDVAGCATCPSRTSRDGNLREPPVYGRGTAPRALPPQGRPTEPPAAPDASGGKPAPLRGLGDLIERGTKAVGIRACGGCQRRRDALNRLVPFNAKPPASPRPAEPTGGERRSGDAT